MLPPTTQLPTQFPAPPSATLFFFFNDTATTEIYTLSLHDALPICQQLRLVGCRTAVGVLERHDLPLLGDAQPAGSRDRKSTRLNSSHSQISYAVFCLTQTRVFGTPQQA